MDAEPGLGCDVVAIWESDGGADTTLTDPGLGTGLSGGVCVCV